MVSYESDFYKGHGEVVLILIVMDNGLLPKKAEAEYIISLSVLILIVMDNGLLHERLFLGGGTPAVLILIVMDNGLLLNSLYLSRPSKCSLNPYCNG